MRGLTFKKVPTLNKAKPKRIKWSYVAQTFLVAAVLMLLLIQWTSLNAKANQSLSGGSGNSHSKSLNHFDQGVDTTKRQTLTTDTRTNTTLAKATALVTGIPESFPKWLRDYIQWHAQQRKEQLTPQNWNATHNNRYLIMTCRRGSLACGGLSDRLQHIPAMVQMAAKTNRLLLIYWDAPAPLEEFLVPRRVENSNNNSKGLESPMGLDWRVPEWMVPLLFPTTSDDDNSATKGCTFIQRVRTIAEEDSKKTKQPTICTRSTMHRHGQNVYDEWQLPGEPSFVEIYHDLWRFLFAPSPPIADILDKEMERMHLQPGNYVMTHVRALYAVADRNDNFIQNLTRNALQCARQLVPHVQQQQKSSLSSSPINTPIFFASDSSLAVQTALEYGNGTVVSTSNTKPMLHLDRANSTNPEDYYNIFVDLLLLGNSRCATFNIGGFGKWGALISYPLFGAIPGGKKKKEMAKNDNKEEIEESSPCWVLHHKRDCFNEKVA